MRLLAIVRAIAVVALLACTAQAQEPFKGEQRENLGPAINSPSVEILPIVSPDGSTLYFDRKHDAANVGGAGDQDDIWFSTRQSNGTWSRSRNAGEPLNSAGSDVLFWISPDGATALLHSGIEVAGAPMGMAIARREGDRWGRPVPIRIEGITSLGESYYAHVAPDGRHMILAYATDTSRPRDLNLYVCTARGSDLTRWGRAVSLGASVNTTGFEGAPFIAADNRTLYFASDGRGGMGSSDLYLARRLDSTWTVWSTPENLGGQINTPRFEASLSIPADGRDLYISGAGFLDEPSFGGADIYRIPLPPEFRPAIVVTVEGRLLAGRRGVRGLVRAERVTDGSEAAATVSDKSGRFEMTLPAGVEYRLTGGADGYAEGVTSLDVRAITASRSIEATIVVGAGRPSAGRPSAGRPRAEEPPSEPGIYFASGSAELGPQAIGGLERALATLRRDMAAGSVTSVTISGHTDDVGETETNVELSRRRAEAVRDWLVARGIDAALVRIEALGESTPAGANDTSRGRARNRRVEVTYVTIVDAPRGN